MNYFCILGNHPALSVAELLTRLEPAAHKEAGEVFMAEIKENIDVKQLIAELGGTIKIGRLIGSYSKLELYDAALAELRSAPKTSKFNFGISLYGKSGINTHKFGLELKSALKSDGHSCRFVTSREKTLSSVVVEQNKLTRDGRELVIIADGTKLWLGITEAVQPFKLLSERDYGRPARDDHSGMLPPKLAQMMINLSGAKKNETILDPFCGSGTIVTEAMMMGYSDIIGSDISSKAISDTKKNIAWIKEHMHCNKDARLEVLDARDLSDVFKNNSIGAIVAETYLGPQRGRIDIKKVIAELTTLYTAVLIEMEKILKPGGRIVLALPVFANGREKINLLEPKQLQKLKSHIYNRAGQTVWREIVIFEKK